MGECGGEGEAREGDCDEGYGEGLRRMLYLNMGSWGVKGPSSNDR